MRQGVAGTTMPLVSGHGQPQFLSFPPPCQSKEPLTSSAMGFTNLGPMACNTDHFGLYWNYRPRENRSVARFSLSLWSVEWSRRAAAGAAALVSNVILRRCALE